MIQEDQKQIITGSLKKEALEKILYKYDVDRIDDLNWNQAHEITTLINDKKLEVYEEKLNKVLGGTNE